MVSDNPGCGGWQFAQQNGIGVVQFPSKKHLPGEHAVEASELPAALQAVGVDFICLAGFLKVGRSAKEQETLLLGMLVQSQPAEHAVAVWDLTTASRLVGVDHICLAGFLEVSHQSSRNYWPSNSERLSRCQTRPRRCRL